MKKRYNKNLLLIVTGLVLINTGLIAKYTHYPIHDFLDGLLKGAGIVLMMTFFVKKNQQKVMKL